jgi:hypothetical protein
VAEHSDELRRTRVKYCETKWISTMSFAADQKRVQVEQRAASKAVCSATRTSKCSIYFDLPVPMNDPRGGRVMGGQSSVRFSKNSEYFAATGSAAAYVMNAVVHVEKTYLPPSIECQSL